MNITPDNLIAAGWRKLGNAWYNGNKRLTNYENEWQSWKEGKSITVTVMSEL